MFCEAYRQSLTDAAASGELTLTLQRHLTACDTCRAAFAEEQSLYAAIDSGLRVVANAEPPATLVPRVRVALNIKQIRPRESRFWLFAAAPLLAACLLLFFHARTRRVLYRPTAQNVPAPGMLEAAATPTVVNTPPKRGVITEQHDGVASWAHRRAVSARPAEVIVEPQEAVALLRYEAELRKRSPSKAQTLFASAIELPSGIQPLEIGEIEVRDLEIPELAKANADKK